MAIAAWSGRTVLWPLTSLKYAAVTMKAIQVAAVLEHAGGHPPTPP